MLGFIATSIISFVSTNIDNIFVMMLLYAKADDKFRKRHIVIGQYLGISILVALSVLGSFGLHFIPQKYVGLLGLLPIILGIKAWINYKKEKVHGHDIDTEKIEANNIFLKQEREPKKLKNVLLKSKSIILKIVSPAILSVTFVSVANGADNIGVYIPLFTGYSVNQLILTILIFAFMMSIWCFLGDRIINFPKIKAVIQTYKHIVIPIIFIVLGIYIIFKSI